MVVFREIRFTQVLSELARRLLPDHPSPLITEIPSQLLAVVYQDRRIACQFANRRVQITDKRGQIPGEKPLTTVAVNAIEAASQSSGGRKEIVAYGYNYTVHLTEPAAANFISARFFSDATKVSSAFKGELQGIGFEATINIPQRQCQVNFALAPVPNTVNLIQTVINYHYEGQSPPHSAEELSQQVAAQYDEFLQVLRQL